MNSRTKSKLVHGLLVSGLVLSLAAPAAVTHFTPLGNTIETALADQVAPSTTTVALHKAMFDKKDAAFFAQDSNKIQNDGTDKNSAFSDKLLHYNPQTMGRIEFTLYDITDIVNQKYPDGKGLTGFSASKAGKIAQENRVDSITKSIQKSFNSAWDDKHAWDQAKLTKAIDSNEYLGHAAKVATKAIDSHGDVTFNNVQAYDASKPQKYHYYAAVETKTPQGFVIPPAEPLVFVAPYTNPSGDKFLDTINLYPKNNTQKLEFDLTKFRIWNSGQNGTGDTKSEEKELAGAKFQLYSGKPGSGKKVGDVLTTDSKGKITAKNLVMGDYYFVEVPSSVADDDAKNASRLAISPIALNNKDNKLTFSIGENGIDPSKLQGSLVDYGKPELDKHLTNGIGEHQSLHRGDHAHFRSHVNVPANLMGSNWQIDATGTKSKSEPYHMFFTRDEPQEHLKDVPGERHLVITTKDGKTLKEGTDYEVMTGKNKWWVNYVVKDLSAADRKLLDDAKNSHDNAKIQKALETVSSGSASDTVAGIAGQKLTYEYDQILQSDTPMDENIVNKIYLDWDDGSGDKELVDQDHTVTYGTHFIKQSSGFMGTGIAAEKLEGAQFAVQDLRTKKWFNGFKDDAATGEKTAQWVDNWQDVKGNGIFESDKDGKFALQGFTEGDYKLREIKAPKGYQLMEETMNFHIGPHTDADTLETPIVVKNNEKTEMPLTGSQQLLIAVAGGVVTVSVLGFAGWQLKKRHA